MENWGAIFTFERILLDDPAITSEATRQAIYGVQAHETAHQWFGDLVTMAWWDDQTVMASDSSQIDCTASARDLTRISLVEDEFRSEEHTSELQSLMRISYAVFCLKKKKKTKQKNKTKKN